MHESVESVLFHLFAIFFCFFTFPIRCDFRFSFAFSDGSSRKVKEKAIAVSKRGLFRLVGFLRFLRFKVQIITARDRDVQGRGRPITKQ